MKYYAIRDLGPGETLADRLCHHRLGLMLCLEASNRFWLVPAGTESITDRRFERVTGNAQTNAHPAQHDSFATSLSKDSAASFRPSTVVR